MDLASWLDKIQALHPTEIELGLGRVRQVATQMRLERPARCVITVAGTNGKGSCVVMLASILREAGYRTGSYTSPHIHRYNERICLLGRDVDDAQLCAAFNAIENCRRGVSLTYFEYGTLAAFHVMQQADLDVAILEVGMGGRLDAVNIVDADLTIISQIGLDHTEWLGPDREAIGHEKAGILRANTPLVCGDPEPPSSIILKAKSLSAPCYQMGRQFHYQCTDTKSWNWQGVDSQGRSREERNLPLPRVDLCNAAVALQALALLPLTVSRDAIEAGLVKGFIPGRWEFFTDPVSRANVLLDVAHNPSAAALLADKLHALKKSRPVAGKIVAVLAMMADKDIKGFCQNLGSVVDIWYIAGVDLPRAMPAEKLAKLVDDCQLQRFEQTFANPNAAYEKACELADQQDLILVTGSFLTVAAIRQKLNYEPAD